MSERPLHTAVAVRDRATGRFLAAGATWTTHAAEALRLEAHEAADLVRRFACEPQAVQVVALEATATRAVA